jgi:hypothetical protein
MSELLQGVDLEESFNGSGTKPFEKQLLLWTLTAASQTDQDVFRISQTVVMMRSFERLRCDC